MCPRTGRCGPDNNIIERHSMAAYNFDFVLARSTGQAPAELRKQQFDAIISDMGRPPDSRAGYTLLEAVRGNGDQAPYFIYAGSRTPMPDIFGLRQIRFWGALGLPALCRILFGGFGRGGHHRSSNGRSREWWRKRAKRADVTPATGSVSVEGQS